MSFKILNPQDQAFIPPSTGWLLAQELEVRHIKGKAKRDFLERAGINKDQLSLILCNQLAISNDFARFLEQEFQITANVWLKLENEMLSHPKSGRGGAREGAGRKELGLKTRQVRISANPEDMKVIEGWLKYQSSAAQSVASMILEVAKPSTRTMKQ